MTTSLTLGEQELQEAVSEWLAAHGHMPAATKATVRIGIDPGDAPVSGPHAYAVATFEGVKRD